MVAETIPEVIEPASRADYFEVMTRAVFQAGVRWSQIAEHWDAYRRAFAEFDPARVALYDDLDVERVLATAGILRMPKKVHAVIRNARAMLETEREFASLAAYLRSFDSYAALAKNFKKRFSFMGEMNVWYFLFRPAGRCRPSKRGSRRSRATIRECARWWNARATPGAPLEITAEAAEAGAPAADSAGSSGE